MPKYSFQCDKCGRVLKEIRPPEDRDREDLCSEEVRVSEDTFEVCAGTLRKQLPRVAEPSVMETVDRNRNVKWRKDQDRRIKKRARDYFRKNEMEDMIAKVGEKEAKRLGWIDKDGKKNKGD